MTRSQSAVTILAPLLIVMGCCLLVGSSAAQEPLSTEPTISAQSGVADTTHAAPSGIAGIVVDSDGTTPVGQTALLLYAADDTFLAQTTSNDDGTYRFDALPAGSYKLWAVPPAEFLPAFYDRRSTFSSASPVSVPASGESVIVNHELVRWGGLSGAVHENTAGAPVPFAKIDVWTVDGQWVSSEIADRGGRYEITRLPPGSYRVTASAQDYHPAFFLQMAGTSATAVDIQTIMVAQGVITPLGNILLEPEGGAAQMIGDATGDGQVNIADFSVLAGSYGTSEGQAGYFAAADFNRDGSVDISDFSILAEHFNSGSAP